jgi:hypothetical protein
MITLLRDHRDGRIEHALDIEDERRRSLFDWLRLFILKRQANAMLRRALRPVPLGRAADLPAYLRRDIGLLN